MNETDLSKLREYVDSIDSIPLNENFWKEENRIIDERKSESELLRASMEMSQEELHEKFTL